MYPKLVLLRLKFSNNTKTKSGTKWKKSKKATWAESKALIGGKSMDINEL